MPPDPTSAEKAAGQRATGQAAPFHARAEEMRRYATRLVAVTSIRVSPAGRPAPEDIARRSASPAGVYEPETRKPRPAPEAAPRISAQITFRLLLVPDRSHFLLSVLWISLTFLQLFFIFLFFIFLHILQNASPGTLLKKREYYDQHSPPTPFNQSSCCVF